MGDPKFSRAKYDTPNHPWQAARIAAENDIIRKYGLKNKTEVWKAQSKVRRFRQSARTLLAKQLLNDPQVKLETNQLLGRLRRMSLLSEGSKLEDVLGLNAEAVLARRLETLVYHKGLATSHKQARQLIVHNHIVVGGRIVNVPGYLVPRGGEDGVMYAQHSALTNEAHPMRPKARAPGEAGPEEAREREFQARKREMRRGPGGRGRGGGSGGRGGGGFGRGPPRGPPGGGAPPAGGRPPGGA
jgi:small subunit ribosomal protein S4